MGAWRGFGKGFGGAGPGHFVYDIDRRLQLRTRSKGLLIPAFPLSVDCYADGLEADIEGGLAMPQDLEVRSQHFLKEMEQAVQVANREILNQRIPAITKENILPLSVSVARLRGQYLAEAFKLAASDAGEAPNEKEIQGLKFHREMYEEARLAYDALMHVIDRGYVELGE
jgi:hypothetical protein